jgi:hypothetical protein
MSKPVAIGPTSRTVIGAVTQDSPPAPPPKKEGWKRLLIPGGLVALAVYIGVKYRP